ncbi:serine dehydratase beta chain, partial [Acinetobacter baumannii]
MFVSVFDLFKIGIGPSSSHTIGPMRAAERFAAGLAAAGQLDRVARVRITLYGSLAWTGKGHATDNAVVLGRAGQVPDRIDPDEVDLVLRAIAEEGRLRLAGQKMIGFDAAVDVIFDFDTVEPRHS